MLLEKKVQKCLDVSEKVAIFATKILSVNKDYRQQ